MTRLRIQGLSEPYHGWQDGRMSWLIRPLNPQTYFEELLRLRSKRTPTVRKGARGDAYTIGLQQALDLWQAAGKVDPLASPILRYYAVTQAALAIAAASPLGNQSWKPGHSHGLTCEVVYPQSNGRLDFSQVFVSPVGDGVAQTLAAALKSDMIPPGTPLADLMASLWHRVYGLEEAITPVYPRRPMSVWVSPVEWGAGGVRVTVTGDFKAAFDADSTRVHEFLAGYPGLARCNNYSVTWHDQGEPWMGLELPGSAAMGTIQAWLDECDVEVSPGITTAKVFLPGLGGGNEKIHPLLTWYVVLYAFSMLARYHGRLWRSRLDLDNEVEAVDTRRLIDTQSVDAICLVTQTLQGFLSP